MLFLGVSSDHPIISPPKSKTRLLSEVPQPHHCVRNDLAWGGTPTCHQGREGLLMLLFVKGFQVMYCSSNIILERYLTTGPTRSCRSYQTAKGPFEGSSGRWFVRLGKRWMDSAWLLHFSVPMFVEFHWAEGCNVAYMLHHCLKFMIADGQRSQTWHYIAFVLQP